MEKTNEVIYELLKEVKSDIKGELKEVRDDIDNVRLYQRESAVLHKENQKTLSDIIAELKIIKEENIVQTQEISENKESLIQHMSRSDKLERLVNLQEKKFNDKIDKIEEPKKARKYIWSVFLKVGGGAGAMYAILRAWEFFKPML